MMYCIVDFNPFFSFFGMPDIYLPPSSAPRACLALLAPRCLFWVPPNTCFRRFFASFALAVPCKSTVIPVFAIFVRCRMFSAPRACLGHGYSSHCRLVCRSSFDFSDVGGKCFLSCAVRATTQRVRFHLSNFKKSPKMPPKIPPAKALQFVFKGSIIVI